VRVLITGVGGQLGRALVRTAPEHVVLVACEHERLDIADAESVTSFVRDCRPDVIINAAAYTNVDAAERECDLARSANTQGPANIAIASRDVRARLIHISTDFVFDGTSSTPYHPDSPTNPLSVYGLTKRDGETAVLGLHPEHSLILRTAWIYASEGHNFVRKMLEILRSKGSARVIADQVGTPTSAQSLAETIWKANQVPALRGVHHWTDAGVASWYDFAVAIAEEAAALNRVPPGVRIAPIATRDYVSPVRRPHYSVLDTTSLASLGIVPVHWRERLRAVLREINDA
jgi:dTDP-4-dehydrorhamnose reductase